MSSYVGNVGKATNSNSMKNAYNKPAKHHNSNCESEETCEIGKSGTSAWVDLRLYNPNTCRILNQDI